MTPSNSVTQDVSCKNIFDELRRARAGLLEFDWSNFSNFQSCARENTAYKTGSSEARPETGVPRGEKTQDRPVPG
jgi:hypothetical protein